MKIFSQKCEFIAAANNEASIVQTNTPEIAFIGYSNVGKSSLLNMLVNRKSLARVSQTPGCTRSINFFNLADKLTIVDLPGYGYARVSKSQEAEWSKLMYAYLAKRAQLVRAFILIDARRGLRNGDKQIVDIMSDVGIPLQFILTKLDKTKPAEVNNTQSELVELIEANACCLANVISTSSVRRTGQEELRQAILKIIENYSK